MPDLTSHRRDYQQDQLRRIDLNTDPTEQFHAWMEAALDKLALDANAMTLATSGSDGMPSARIVLLKHYDQDGFCWYTDTSSDKGQQLAQNPQAALLFFWPPFERQVRVQGNVICLPDSASESYFNSRPTGSRYSAAASHQSQAVASRDTVTEQRKQLTDQYGDKGPPRPERWGGYCLQPETFEFWQGRTDRLHDRFRYSRTKNGWQIDRLSP